METLDKFFEEVFGMQPRRILIDQVKNGSRYIYRDNETKTYWRTLKSAKNLGPKKHQIKNPRYVTS